MSIKPLKTETFFKLQRLDFISLFRNAQMPPNMIKPKNYFIKLTLSPYLDKRQA